MKPPQGLALMKFPDGFDPEMAYQLREREPLTLEDMQRGEISVEANLIAKRARMKSEKRVTYRDEVAPSTSNTKLDNLVKTMERMMERMNVNERAYPGDNHTTPQNIN